MIDMVRVYLVRQDEFIFEEKPGFTFLRKYHLIFIGREHRKHIQVKIRN